MKGVFYMNSKFYLHKGKNRKAENGRPWIYIDEINESLKSIIIKDIL